MPAPALQGSLPMLLPALARHGARHGAAAAAAGGDVPALLLRRGWRCSAPTWRRRSRCALKSVACRCQVAGCLPRTAKRGAHALDHAGGRAGRSRRWLSSAASQRNEKTSPSSSGLPMATCSKRLGQRRVGAHQEQVPELRMAARVAFDAGFAVAVDRAQRLQRARRSAMPDSSSSSRRTASSGARRARPCPWAAACRRRPGGRTPAAGPARRPGRRRP